MNFMPPWYWPGLVVGCVCSLCWVSRAAGEPLAPAPAGSFSIVVIPDTQKYHASDATDSVAAAGLINPVFTAHTTWIVEQIEPQRIAFVSHVGDIVDENARDQWQVARQQMDRLHGQVPYGISVGNHDMTSRGDASLFQEFFPAARYQDFDWYGGTYEVQDGRTHVSGNNANSYQLFSAGGLDFVFLHLECNAPDNVLEWANQILAEHADRLALVTTHMDLGPLEKPNTSQGFYDDPKGRMRWTKIHGERGNSAQQMWDRCFRRHANLRMIFSGDQSRTTAMHLQTEGEHGNTVHALLSDYTSSGPLRVYRFLPANNEVHVITYDTTRGTLVDETSHVPGRQHHQFTLDVDLSR